MSTDEQPAHQWHAAAWIPLTPREARIAVARTAVTVPGPTRIDVLDVVCLRCRREYADVARGPCVDRTFIERNLIGGRPGERGKPRRPATQAVEVRP